MISFKSQRMLAFKHNTALRDSTLWHQFIQCHTNQVAFSFGVAIFWDSGVDPHIICTHLL